jgi:hypothetical protein
MARIPFPAHDTAAEVRAHHPLFEWAREQAAAAKEIDAKLAAAREKHDRTVTVLHESMEFRDVEAARERLADAKKAALEDDDEVQEAKDALKKARAALKATAASAVRAEKEAKGAVKALAEVKAETERGIVAALATGKVPSPLIVDEK